MNEEEGNGRGEVRQWAEGGKGGKGCLKISRCHPPVVLRIQMDSFFMGGGQREAGGEGEGMGKERGGQRWKREEDGRQEEENEKRKNERYGETGRGGGQQGK